jgi:hypothetical protein
MLATQLAERVKDVTTSWAVATASAAEREKVVVGVARATAQHLVQASLFGQQRAPLQSARGRAVQLEDAEHYREQLASTSRLTPTLRLCAVLIVAHRRRT